MDYHRPNPNENHEDDDQLVESFETLLANLGIPNPEFGDNIKASMVATKDQILHFMEQIATKYPEKGFSIILHRVGKYTTPWATNNPALVQEIFVPILLKMLAIARQSRN